MNQIKVPGLVQAWVVLMLSIAKCYGENKAWQGRQEVMEEISILYMES